MKRLIRQTIVRQGIIIGIAIAWSLIYCAIAGSLPSIQKSELDVQDSLIRLHKPGLPPEQILLLKVDSSEQSGYDLHNLSQLNLFYAELVESLIDQGAKVVVLNLPEQMKQYVNTDTRFTQPLKDSIRNHFRQIVLVARPSAMPSGAATLNLYNHLLPSKGGTRSMAPDQIISYFRYAPNARGLNNPARRAELFGRFSDEDNPNVYHRVKSVAILALEKFYTASNDRDNLHRLFSLQALSPLQVNFWGAANTFPNVQSQQQCSSSEHCRGVIDSSQNLRGRLILVDLPEGRLSESYGERTPYGEMSIAEIQANLIASLMTHSFLRTIAKGFDSAITTFGFVLMGLYIASRSKVRLIYRSDFWFFLGLIGGYLGLSFILFWQGLILPLSLPILGWIGTGAGIAAFLILKQSVQQRQKLAERQAVLMQTRKLLHRVATDVHDGSLQELKLVMDKLELLNIQHPLIDPILDQLEAIGLSLRKQLSNTRTIAEKLEITPELQFGLSQGIEHWLAQLIRAGDLTLKLNLHLQPLREPNSDSAWIDAREDIFRFFREAIANIMHHVQPPNGTATQISIALSRSGGQCQLVIENDGVSSHQRKRGGYGTKLMTTIAAELPNGVWERIALEKGGMRVTLKWTIEL